MIVSSTFGDLGLPDHSDFYTVVIIEKKKLFESSPLRH